MFADSPELDEINVLIVDEVHERSVHVDLLLTNVKNLLREGRRNRKEQRTRCCRLP
jgi:HrpA-like RNA helicase